MSRNNLILLLLALVIVCSCVFVATTGVAVFFVSDRLGKTTQPQSQHPLVPVPLDTPTPRPLRRLTPTAAVSPGTPPAPTPTVSARPSTDALIDSVEVPDSDPRDLVMRLRPEVGEPPLVVNDVTPVYQEGDHLQFWVGNLDTDENFQIDAELVVKSEHLYMWVEAGADVDEGDLRRAAAFFDQQIYPTDRAFFGSEWSPGIDNDPRLHVLHATGIGSTVAGYFSSADEISSLINPYSNEKEMFYINLDNNPPGSRFYNGTLAHEFQHMIHWYEDKNESTWLNEGAAELATQLNGVARSDSFVRPDEVFASDPDLQLNTWPDPDEGDSYPYYGSAYLFMNYFLSRFGEEATKALVADPENGMKSVDDVLHELNLGLTADELFGDWVVANWLDDPTLDDGRWGYPDYDPATMAVSKHYSRTPARGEGEVHQYAADYITVSAAGDVTISFQGDATNRLADTDAYSGDWVWWSHRVDESDTRLTLPVDLSGVDQATLQFRTWYDLESLWDYAYLEISGDGGETWTVLETDRTTRENPQGNAYGPGYTGLSDGDRADWVQERVDISAFAGQPVLLRWEYVTDAAVTHPGMFIDDIAIPEIGLFDDLEQGPGAWQSQGWILTNNVLRQRWLVQVIGTSDDGSLFVERVPVDAGGAGTLHLQHVSDKHDLVLVVSALAPVTVETARYQYEIR
ncbi:MAG: hypothetical protein GXP37_14260 [Chloroflexi bacterium]|nr:hypothetical protein [Chloroflexota bacterium]